MLIVTVYNYIYNYIYCVLCNLINCLGSLAVYIGSREVAATPSSARFAFLGRSRSPYDEVLGEAGATNEVAIDGPWGSHNIIPRLMYLIYDSM